MPFNLASHSFCVYVRLVAILKTTLGKITKSVFSNGDEAERECGFADFAFFFFLHLKNAAHQ